MCLDAVPSSRTLPIPSPQLENLFVSPSRGVVLGDYGLALSVHEEKPISPVGTLGALLICGNVGALCWVLPGSLPGSLYTHTHTHRVHAP